MSTKIVAGWGKSLMTVGMIVGLILLPFALAFMFGANKKHREETGVNAPTRDGWRRIRRNARTKGISEAEAYNQWLNRKTSKLRKDAMAYDFSYAADSRPRSENHHVHDANAKFHKRPPITNDGDEVLMSLAAARNWSLHRQANGKYYILNLNRSPTAFVTFPADPAKHEFTGEEVQRLLVVI